MDVLAGLIRATTALAEDGDRALYNHVSTCTEKRPCRINPSCDVGKERLEHFKKCRIRHCDPCALARLIVANDYQRNVTRLQQPLLRARQRFAKARKATKEALLNVSRAREEGFDLDVAKEELNRSKLMHSEAKGALEEICGQIYTEFESCHAYSDYESVDDAWSPGPDFNDAPVYDSKNTSPRAAPPTNATVDRADSVMENRSHEVAETPPKELMSPHPRLTRSLAHTATESSNEQASPHARLTRSVSSSLVQNSSSMVKDANASPQRPVQTRQSTLARQQPQKQTDTPPSSKARASGVRSPGTQEPDVLVTLIKARTSLATADDRSLAEHITECKAPRPCTVHPLCDAGKERLEHYGQCLMRSCETCTMARLIEANALRRPVASLQLPVVKARAASKKCFLEVKQAIERFLDARNRTGGSSPETEALRAAMNAVKAVHEASKSEYARLSSLVFDEWEAAKREIVRPPVVGDHTGPPVQTERVRAMSLCEELADIDISRYVEPPASLLGNRDATPSPVQPSQLRSPVGSESGLAGIQDGSRQQLQPAQKIHRPSDPSENTIEEPRQRLQQQQQQQQTSQLDANTTEVEGEWNSSSREDNGGSFTPFNEAYATADGATRMDGEEAEELSSAAGSDAIVLEARPSSALSTQSSRPQSVTDRTTVDEHQSLGMSSVRPSEASRPSALLQSEAWDAGMRTSEHATTRSAEDHHFEGSQTVTDSKTQSTVNVVRLVTDDLEPSNRDSSVHIDGFGFHAHDLAVQREGSGEEHHSDTVPRPPRGIDLKTQSSHEYVNGLDLSHEAGANEKGLETNERGDGRETREIDLEGDDTNKTSEINQGDDATRQRHQQIQGSILVAGSSMGNKSDLNSGSPLQSDPYKAGQQGVQVDGAPAVASQSQQLIKSNHPVQVIQPHQPIHMNQSSEKLVQDESHESVRVVQHREADNGRSDGRKARRIRGWSIQSDDSLLLDLTSAPLLSSASSLGRVQRRAGDEAATLLSLVRATTHLASTYDHDLLAHIASCRAPRPCAERSECDLARSVWEHFGGCDLVSCKLCTQPRLVAAQARGQVVAALQMPLVRAQQALTDALRRHREATEGLSSGRMVSKQNLVAMRDDVQRCTGAVEFLAQEVYRAWAQVPRPAPLPELSLDHALSDMGGLRPSKVDIGPSALEESKQEGGEHIHVRKILSPKPGSPLPSPPPIGRESSHPPKSDLQGSHAAGSDADTHINVALNRRQDLVDGSGGELIRGSGEGSTSQKTVNEAIALVKDENRLSTEEPSTVGVGKVQDNTTMEQQKQDGMLSTSKQTDGIISAVDQKVQGDGTIVGSPETREGPLSDNLERGDNARNGETSAVANLGSVQSTNGPLGDLSVIKSPLTSMTGTAKPVETSHDDQQQTVRNPSRWEEQNRDHPRFVAGGKRLSRMEKEEKRPRQYSVSEFSVMSFSSILDSSPRPMPESPSLVPSVTRVLRSASKSSPKRDSNVANSKLGSESVPDATRREEADLSPGAHIESHDVLEVKKALPSILPGDNTRPDPKVSTSSLKVKPDVLASLTRAKVPSLATPEDKELLQHVLECKLPRPCPANPLCDTGKERIEHFARCELKSCDACAMARLIASESSGRSVASLQVSLIEARKAIALAIKQVTEAVETKSPRVANARAELKKCKESLDLTCVRIWEEWKQATSNSLARQEPEVTSAVPNENITEKSKSVEGESDDPSPKRARVEKPAPQRDALAVVVKANTSLANPSDIQLRNHVISCESPKPCSFPFCDAAKDRLRHFKACSNPTCAVCVLARLIAAVDMGADLARVQIPVMKARAEFQQLEETAKQAALAMSKGKGQSDAVSANLKGKLMEAREAVQAARTKLAALCQEVFVEWDRLGRPYA